MKGCFYAQEVNKMGKTDGISQIENAVFVIFGATGDLTKRKLIPALYRLYAKEIIKNKVPIVCVARSIIAKDEFVKLLNFNEFVPHSKQKTLSKFLQQISYYPIDIRKIENNSDLAEARP